MTHTLTHTGKGLYGNNGAKSAADLILLEQKWSDSLENQGPEGSQSVGKDEVGGSNPPSSSRKHLKSSDFGCFLLQKIGFSYTSKITTRIVTYMRKCEERFKAHWIGSFASYPVRFFFLPFAVSDINRFCLNLMAKRILGWDVA